MKVACGRSTSQPAGLHLSRERTSALVPRKLSTRPPRAGKMLLLPLRLREASLSKLATTACPWQSRMLLTSEDNQ